MGSLAYRVEGDMWVAYFARPDTMDGAIMLGSIALLAMVEHPVRKRQFIHLMEQLAGDIVHAAPKG